MKIRALLAACIVLATADPGLAAVEVRASAQPATVGVGDVFSYVLEVHVPPEGAEPDAADLRASPGPFRVLEPPRLDRTDDESGVVLRLTQRLACLDAGCLPTSGPRRVLLQSARVRVGGAVVTAAPVTVRVRPRVAPASVAGGPRAYRRETLLPAPEGPVEPAAAVWLLGGVALAIAWCALAVAASVVRPLRRRRRENALERAIRLLRESARHAPPERRVAADLLARVAGDESAVADQATALAWSPPDPSAADAETLAARAAQEAA